MEMLVPISSSFKQRYNSLGLQSRFVQKIVTLISSLESWTRKYYHKVFDKLYIIAIGGIKEVEGYDAAFALSELNELRKNIPKIRKLVAVLEMSGFVEDESLASKSKIVLDKIYELEGELKIKAFSKKNHKHTNRDFINELSNKSKEAISLSLNHN